MAVTTVKRATRLFQREIKNRFDGDLNREISELITNSIDSYGRLIKNGLMNPNSEKKVIVKLCKAIRKQAERNTIQVIDYAEGMSKDTLLKIFSEKGANNNQGNNNSNIRGLFGLGASDCMSASAIEGKSAEYYSFKDGELTNLRFKLSKNGNDIEIEDNEIIDKKQIKNLREKFGIEDNGTVAIFGIPDSVTLEKDILSFKYSLETIFLLRNLLANDKNVVILDAYGKSVRLSSKEYQLKSPFLIKNNIKFNYKGVEYKGSISFYKNEDKTKNPTDILVEDDRGNIYDNQMFGYSKAQGNEKLSGILVLNGFWDLLNDSLEKGESLIKDDRTGFDTSKKFGKQLQESISKAISEALNYLMKEEGNKNISLSQTKNYKDFLKFLNKDLNSNRPSIGRGSKEKIPPANGIEFARNKANVTSGHSYDLKLYINKDMLSDNRIVTLTTISNDGNLEVNNEIIIKDEDLNNDLIIKSTVITALKETHLPVILTAKYDDYVSSCDLSVIDEEIIYPENGIQFEKKEVTFTPDVNHKKIRLYFDNEQIHEDDIINITNDSNGKLKCSLQTTSIKEGIMITDNIGYILLEFNGGDLKDHYTVVASYKNGKDSMNIEINASPYSTSGSTGDISDYEIDPTGYYVEQKSYYDLTDGTIKIVKGNPINDYFISHYNDKLNGKSLMYVITLVCYEAAKLYAEKEINNGHIQQNDIYSYEYTINCKQKEYFEKYISFENK